MGSEAATELISDDGEYKAVVEEREDGNYTISLWKWTRELVPDYGEVCAPFWSLASRGVTLTDTLDSARRLAAEKLASVGHSQRTPGQLAPDKSQ